uniref:Uncharacterized protein n=1 Tax=viral metagenome TaxID=1070528 RepID=A0A6C0BAG2_9ZZZZ
MNEVQQYDIIKIIKIDSVEIIGSFHSMVDGEIILFVPPTIQTVPTSEVTHVSRIKRKDEYDISKIDAFFYHSSYIFKKRYRIHDVLMITFDDDSEIEAKITEIAGDCLTLQLESQEFIYINFKYQTTIPLGILEIKRKQTHDLDEEVEEDKTYTVVSYNIDESKCRYTLEIQINAILQYLNFIQLDGSLYAQRYRELMLLYPYGTSLTPDQSNLSWIYPVTDAKTKLTNIESFKKSLEGSLMCYKKSLVTNKEISYDTVQSVYNTVLQVLDKKYPNSQTLQTYLFPESVILQFEGITASKEKETNWGKKIQNWLTYVIDETLPVNGYAALPPTSIPFSKYYLPETQLIQRINLNMIAHYHLFNVLCEPSFTYKQVDDYNTLIPTLDKLIQQYKLPAYSLYEFIQVLEPYHIYSNQIDHSYVEKIQKRIKQHIKKFLSGKSITQTASNTILSVNEYYQKTYVSTSELYAYALSQDSANTFIVSQLTPKEKIEPLPKPTNDEAAFIMKPPEPICELKKECDETGGPSKLKNFTLSLYHSSSVDNKNKMDISFLNKKIKYNMYQLLKYNNKFNQVHSLFESVSRLPPSYEMFYQIMAYPLTKRYTTLLQFLTKYTTLDKSTQIYLCNTTSTPLVPILFKLLADAYLTNIDEYNTLLYNYCRSSLSISIEDGYYKDKFTGLSLVPIERVQSFDEMIRSARIELEEAAPLEFTPDQVYIETHIQLVWKEITNKPLLTRHTILPFVNDMCSTYNITTKTLKISPNYLLSLLIYVFIQFDIPCDKILDEIGKHKHINKIDLGFIGTTTPFSFLSSIQKYAPVISKLCGALDTKYNKHAGSTLKIKRKRKDDKETFMPFSNSNHPVLSTIKAQLQQTQPIHYVNGELKRINQTFVDLKLPKQKQLSQHFESYIQKVNFPPTPDIEFHFDIQPELIPMKKYPDIYEEYKTSEPLDSMKRQIGQLQTILQELSSKTVNDIIKKYPTHYFANYIKTVTQFYATLTETGSLKIDAIPITQIFIIAPTHRDTIERVLNNYYKDVIYNDKWGNTFLDSQTILEELKQPLTEKTKLILIYYLYTICRNLPKDVVQFVNTKLKSELNIPDYSDIKKRMALRQSVERQNFVRTSKQRSPIEQTLNSIIETDITKTSYNIAQFTSRVEDALKSDGDKEKGDAGNKGDDGNDGEDGNDGGNDE